MIRKVCYGSIFEGEDFSREVPLDDSRRNVLALGGFVGVGNALRCPAGSGTSSWVDLSRHNKTRVSPMRAAGSQCSSDMAFSSFPFFRPRGSMEESHELSQPAVALSSVARSPVCRPPASASGRLYGVVIPERSSP